MEIRICDDHKQVNFCREIENKNSVWSLLTHVLVKHKKNLDFQLLN